MHLLKFALPDRGLKPSPLDQIQRSGSGNDFLLANLAALAPDGAAVHSVQPLAEVLGGLKARAYDLGAAVREEKDDGLFLIWRSPTLGFPNSAQAYLETIQDKTQVSFYARAAFGQMDFGANRRFIQRWAAVL